MKEGWILLLSNCKRIVFKVGTSTLTYKTGKLNLHHLADLVRVLADLRNAGLEVVLVTSGAIGVGVGKLGLAEKPQDTPGRQAAATIGQCELMFIYDKLFGEYGNTVGQLLITKSDVDDNLRRDNLVNTFEQLFAFGVIPIINENDSVAVDEIVYGDNDCLSAIVAKLIGADVLIILSDVAGLYDADPTENAQARLISVVEKIDDNILKLAGGASSDFGTGGMITKIHAAQIATAAGINVVITDGSKPTDIYNILAGEQVGTMFCGKK